MFGYVTPLTPELRVKEHTAYRAVYCGICRAIGGSCLGASALPARLALRYDSVFLVLLRMLLTREEIKAEKHRCLAHPLLPRPMACATPSVRYGAEAGALLLAHSLRDHAEDERGVRGLACRLLLPYADHLRRRAADAVGRDTDERIADCLARLKTLEEQGEPSPDRVRSIFGELLGEVFAHGLPEREADVARRIGEALGRWIYLADALDDLEEDVKRERYNPLRFCERDPEVLRSTMMLDLALADRTLSSVEGGDEGCRAILENILRLGLPERTEGLIQRLGKATL